MVETYFRGRLLIFIYVLGLFVMFVFRFCVLFEVESSAFFFGDFLECFVFLILLSCIFIYFFDWMVDFREMEIL